MSSKPTNKKEILEKLHEYLRFTNNEIIIKTEHDFKVIHKDTDADVGVEFNILPYSYGTTYIMMFKYNEESTPILRYSADEIRELSNESLTVGSIRENIIESFKIFVDDFSKQYLLLKGIK